MQTNANSKPQPLKSWLGAIGRSRSFWYDLDEASKPLHTRTGALIVVLEAPEVWLERMRLAGGAVTKRKYQQAAA